MEYPNPIESEGIPQEKPKTSLYIIIISSVILISLVFLAFFIFLNLNNGEENKSIEGANASFNKKNSGVESIINEENLPVTNESIPVIGDGVTNEEGVYLPTQEELDAMSPVNVIEEEAYIEESIPVIGDGVTNEEGVYLPTQEELDAMAPGNVPQEENITEDVLLVIEDNQTYPDVYLPTQEELDAMAPGNGSNT